MQAEASQTAPNNIIPINNIPIKIIRKSRDKSGLRSQ